MRTLRKTTQLTVAAAGLFAGVFLTPGAVAASASAPEPFYWYRIIVAHSSQCLDVAHVRLESGAKVVQGHCGGVGSTTNQHWRVEYVNGSGGPVRIVARHSRKCLDVAGASRAHAAGVIQATCGGPAATSQLWRVRYVKTVGSHHWYWIVNQNSGKCLDVAHGLINHGTRVVQGTCGGPGAGANQLWRRQTAAVTWPQSERG
ncbi:RICIN domain-containing protein [Planobispora siamensis]|uniref:Ricin B lectin domain-containing protein n=1 Tax=Planobispora siamensis TaxID=936338 RepID=A0A8J3SLW9_9ACTN|nr:RICIN domain-containing protein [Planobispora siamensis]GIH96863.1 hypothetical protein Psi01_74930 [Planobispora siamensis]